MTDKFQLQNVEQSHENEDMLSTGEVGKIFGVRANTVLNWIKRGQIRGVLTPGGHWRVPISAVREFGQARFGQGNDDPAVSDVI